MAFETEGETLGHRYTSLLKKGFMMQVMNLQLSGRYLPSMCEALGLIPSTAKKKCALGVCMSTLY
jgi:hypothetical protein